MNLKKLQAKFESRNKGNHKKKKCAASMIIIFPRTYQSVDFDSIHHYGIKKRRAKRPEANKPHWKE